MVPLKTLSKAIKILVVEDEIFSQTEDQSTLKFTIPTQIEITSSKILP